MSTSSESELSGVLLHAAYASLAEIEVAAERRVVWKYILQMSSWITDFHFEHVAGPVGAEGEVRHLWAAGAEGLAAVTDARDRTPENAIVLQTLAIVPEKLWYGVNPPKRQDGKVVSGANVIVLHSHDGVTTVSAVRSKDVLCPSAAVRDATQKEMLDYQPIAQARWTEKYLPRLKALAEGREGA